MASDPRGLIKKILEEELSEPVVRELITDALRAEREAWMTCSKCGKHKASVRVPDWAARRGWVEFLTNTGFGKPLEAERPKREVADDVDFATLSDAELEAIIRESGEGPEGAGTSEGAG